MHSVFRAYGGTHSASRGHAVPPSLAAFFSDSTPKFCPPLCFVKPFPGATICKIFLETAMPHPKGSPQQPFRKSYFLSGTCSVFLHLRRDAQRLPRLRRQPQHLPENSYAAPQGKPSIAFQEIVLPFRDAQRLFAPTAISFAGSEQTGSIYFLSGQCSARF